MRKAWVQGTLLEGIFPPQPDSCLTGIFIHLIELFVSM